MEMSLIRLSEVAHNYKINLISLGDGPAADVCLKVYPGQLWFTYFKSPVSIRQ